MLRFVLAAAAAFVLLAGLSATRMVNAQTAPAQAGRAEAVFAGGCFWCLEHDLEERDGVISAVSGYAGGRTANPTYQNYERGGHIEVVRVTYDPARVSYAQLVSYFFRHVDPTDAGGQFCDRGHAYTTAVFVANAEQRRIAEAEIARLSRHLRIATPVEDLGRFWPAEDYHQDYAEKNPVRYNLYRLNCGRDARVREVWRNVP